MINIIIAYDDNDSELGNYFEDSYTDLNTNLSKLINVNILPIRGLECTEENIINQTISLNNNPFIFIGLSHGNQQQLLTENAIFVDSKKVEHFKNALFYSPACSTSLDLGNKLIENDCFCYIGCSVDTLATFEDYHSYYIECENYCFKYFLNSEITIKEAFNSMLSFFDEQIDTLLEKCDDEVLLAMELQHNKDSFVLYGNGNLTKNDFYIQF